MLVTSVPTAFVTASHTVASTRRCQLLTVLASSQSSLRRPKLTEPVSAFGGRRTRSVSTMPPNSRHLAPRSRSHATATTRPIHQASSCVWRARMWPMAMMPITHCAGSAAIQTAHDVHARHLVRDPMISRVAVRPEALPYRRVRQADRQLPRTHSYYTSERA